MNRTQLIVLWVGIAVFVVLGLTTPTSYSSGRRGSDSYSHWNDYGPLIVHLSGTVLVTAALIYTFKNRNKRQRSDPSHQPRVSKGTYSTEFKEDSPTTPAREDTIAGELAQKETLKGRDFEREVADLEQEAAVRTVEPPSFSKHYGGIGRIGCFFGLLGLTLVWSILTTVTRGDPAVSPFIDVIAIAISFVLVASRLHNIGASGWWSLLILLPIANLFIAVKCVICPKGYQETKKLDTAGKIILAFILAVSVFAFIVGMVALVRLDSGTREKPLDTEVQSEPTSQKSNSESEVSKLVQFPEYISEKHNFKVRFPGKPEVVDYGVVTYGSVTHYTVEIEQEGAYNIIVNDLPKPVLSDAAIKAFLDGYLPGRLALFGDNATVLQSQQVFFLGHKALQYEYMVKSEDASGYFKGIYFVTGKLGYGISTVCTEESKPLVYAKYQDFLESFRLLTSH